MIKVNLVGASRKKGAKAGGKKIALPKNAMPLVLVAMVLGTAGAGYSWYSSVSGQNAALVQQIAAANKEKIALDAIIKADQVYEARKAALENRVKIIEGLQRNQVTPVLSLDILSEAIDRTEYIWLSSLSQNNANFSMSGTGTSHNAVADFISNLTATGYFPRVDLQSSIQSGANVAFAITAEFAPPKQDTAPASAAPGGN